MTGARSALTPCIRFCVAAAALIAATSAVAADQSLAKKFIIRDPPKPVQAIQFTNGDGKFRSLSDFHGKAVLLNIWATWCVPCRKEMPALDRLQAALGGPGFEVVPLSIDRGGVGVVRKFFAELGIQKLGIYLDVSGDVTRKLSVVGLPTTLLIDREGREVGRVIGPAAWDTPENVAFVRCILAKGHAEKARGNSIPAAASCGGRTVHFRASSATKN